jgi:hypothetical protein
MALTNPGDFPSEPLRRSCRPPSVGDYDRYRSCLRKDFSFRCVYCQSHETEVGPGAKYGGFEIEHFKPQEKFSALATRYDNLLWACRACNGAKWHKWPSAEEIARGYEFVDPSRDVLGDHLELYNQRVVPKTTAGAYMVDEIDLNSPIHRYRRERRTTATKRFRSVDALANAARDAGTLSPERLNELLQDLQSIRSEILPTAPHDAPSSCLCEEKVRRKK